MDALYTDPVAFAANEYMRQAVRNIDEAFGDGYAKNHPELIGAYMQTVALEEQHRASFHASGTRSATRS